jgi:hypothetical protein
MLFERNDTLDDFLPLFCLFAALSLRTGKHARRRNNH